MVNLEKLGSFGEGRKRKRLDEYVRLVNSFEPEVEEVMTGDLPARTADSSPGVVDLPRPLPYIAASAQPGQ